jgi:thioredoxin-like negative regulator of GroEL
MPIWTKVVSQYNIPIAKMELTVMKKIPTEHTVSGFPNVIIHENGKRIQELSGSRNEKDLHKFITDNFKPETKTKKISSTNMAPKDKKTKSVVKKKKPVTKPAAGSKKPNKNMLKK